MNEQERIEKAEEALARALRRLSFMHQATTSDRREVRQAIYDALDALRGKSADSDA